MKGLQPEHPPLKSNVRRNHPTEKGRINNQDPETGKNQKNRYKQMCTERFIPERPNGVALQPTSSAEAPEHEMLSSFRMWAPGTDRARRCEAVAARTQAVDRRAQTLLSMY